MKKRLIITGWGKSNRATAAAVIVRRFMNEDIEIVVKSKDRLPGYLLNLVDSGAINTYGQIFIVGIQVNGEMAAMEKASKYFSRQKRPIYFYSKKSGEGSSDPGLKFRSCATIVEGDGELTELVASYFGIDTREDIMELTRKGHELFNEERRNRCIDILEAASYRHRNYDDDSLFISIVQSFAALQMSPENNHENQKYIEEYQRLSPYEIRGSSKETKALLFRIKQYSTGNDFPVLILGPNGSGKELVAQNIHANSSRKDKKMVAFNCACISPDLVLSQLFGHKKGAFTGATDNYGGLFREAEGGTLFLDEIGELSLSAQSMLLRVLSTHKAQPLGSAEEYDVNVRLITATNRDLPAMVREGTFREDLLHRLNVLSFKIVPLQDRKEDLKDIANSYWVKVLHQKALESEEIKALKNYDYPGNIRELLTILDRAFVMKTRNFEFLINEQREILQDFRGIMADSSVESSGIQGAGIIQESQHNDNRLETAIRCHIKKIYDKNGGIFSKTAAELDCAINTVKKYVGQ